MATRKTARPSEKAPEPGPNAEEAKSESARAEEAGVPPSRKGSQAPVGDIFKGFAKSTSRVVEQAASILEEELAAGILAAKQIEERMIDVRQIRSGEPNEVMQRLRRDVHEAVDIIIDVLNAATTSVGDLAQRAITIRGLDKSRKAGQVAVAIPTLAVADPVKGGDTAEVTMSVANDSDTLTAEFSFHSSDLVSASGDRIAASNVDFAPPKLSLLPHLGEKVRIILRVPITTPQGTYAGLIQATNLSQLRAVLTLQVG